MTVIRLDAATLAEIRATGRVVLADESGTPVAVAETHPIEWPSEEELNAKETGETYSLAEVLAHLKTLEKA